MKKTLCALAIGSTLITPVMAFADDIKIYGRAHVSLDYLDDGDKYNEVALSSNSSRLGFKAEKKFENLTAFAQIESQINFASGSADGGSIDFSTRDTFVGLKGDFGQVRVGRFDSPFKAARSPVNVFGDQLGDLRNVTRVGNVRFDERNENTIEYKSPKLGDFTVLAALSLHEGTTPGYTSDVEDGADRGDSRKNQAYDLAVNYKSGPVDVNAAYEKYEDDHSRNGRDGFRLAGSYKLTDDLTLGALYQNLSYDGPETAANTDAQVFGLTGSYKFAPKTTLNAHVFQRDADFEDADSTLITVGVEHRLDSAVRVYGNLATMLNDKNARLTPWEQARSTNVTGVNGEDSLGLSVGMRYDF